MSLSEKYWDSNDITIFDSYLGVLTANQTIQAITFSNPTLISSIQYATITPPTTSAVFNLLNNGNNIGSLTVSSATGTQPVTAYFDAGDLFTIQAPAVPDNSLSGLAFNYTGTFQ